MKAAVREYRSQLFKVRAALQSAERIAIHIFNIQQSRKFLIRGFHAAVSADDISGFQVKATDLGRRDINVVLTRKKVFASNEAKAIRHNFQNSAGRNAAVHLLLKPVCTILPGRLASLLLAAAVLPGLICLIKIRSSDCSRSAVWGTAFLVFSRRTAKLLDQLRFSQRGGSLDALFFRHFL